MFEDLHMRKFGSATTMFAFTHSSFSQLICCSTLLEFKDARFVPGQEGAGAIVRPSKTVTWKV